MQSCCGDLARNWARGQPHSPPKREMEICIAHSSRRCVRLRLTLACASQPLDDVLTVHEGFSDKKHSCGLEHCEFQITTAGGQPLLFRAMSREERDAWIGHLKPRLQGYLLHTQLAQGGYKQFKTLWYVLKTHRLHCFKKPADTKVAMAALNLASVVLKTKEESGIDSESISADLDFFIHYGDDVHLIRCENVGNRDEWLVALREAKRQSEEGDGAAAGGAAFRGSASARETASPRFGGLKKGARVLSKKMNSATNLVDGAIHGSVHGSIHLGKSVADVAGGVAGGALHLTSSAAQRAGAAVHGMREGDADEEYSAVGGAEPQVPILEGGKKIANPFAAGQEDEGGATPPPPPDAMAGAARQVNPMNFGHMDEDEEDEDEEESVPLPPPGGAMGAGAVAGGIPLPPGTPGTGAEAAVGAMSAGMQSMDLGPGSDAPSISDAGSSMEGSFDGTGGSAEGGGGGGASAIDSDLQEIEYAELQLDKKIGRGSFGAWPSPSPSRNKASGSWRLCSQVRCISAIGEARRSRSRC